MPKILMIHTGGTLMMRSGAATSPLEPDVYTKDLLIELPVLRTIGTIETRIQFNLDSGDMQPHHWVTLAQTIHDEIHAYDGVVVVHGTDVMAYTASALAFLLPGLDRPVVLTGAQRPLFEIRTDARQNLVDACHIATLPVPEVGIAFASKFMRGCRSTKLDAWGFDAFSSPLCQPLVELGIGAIIAPHVLPRARRAGSIRVSSRTWRAAACSPASSRTSCGSRSTRASVGLYSRPMARGTFLTWSPRSFRRSRRRRAPKYR